MPEAELQKYLIDMNATPEERGDVLRWTLQGVDFMDNPWGYAEENGRSMDLISAMRIAEELRLQAVT